MIKKKKIRFLDWLLIKNCNIDNIPFKLVENDYRVIYFIKDCEPIWLERDNNVKNFCSSHKVKSKLDHKRV